MTWLSKSAESKEVGHRRFMGPRRRTEPGGGGVAGIVYTAFWNASKPVAAPLPRRDEAIVPGLLLNRIRSQMPSLLLSMKMLKATSVGVDQLPQVETPNSRVEPVHATPAYWMSAKAGAFAGSRGETTCSSKGVTRDTSSVGNVPLQLGPATRVPVHTAVPLSGSIVLPLGAPPVAMLEAPAMAKA